MKSTRQKVEQLSGLLGTKDLQPKTAKFVQDMALKFQNSPQKTPEISEKQLAWIEDLYDQHFA